MKKILALLLVGLMLLLLPAGCGSSQSAADFEWSREGLFGDADDNLLSVIPSDDAENPGWYVGCMLDEGMYGWYIQQEGSALHGNLVDPAMEGEEAFVVTLTEEGEDGIQLAVENGKTYHFTPTEIPEAAISVSINTEGSGQIAYAKEGETPEFDDEYPYQSSYLGLEGPETYVFAAKPDDGWKFLRWTRDGEEISKDAEFTVSLTESAEYVAVFGVAGTDETPVDLSSVTTLGELLGLPDYGSSGSEETYVYVFEQDGRFYRAVAASSPEVFAACFDLDAFDEADQAKLREILSPLPVLRIDDLSAAIPSQEMLDALVGKSGADLLADGWTIWGWDLDALEFGMDHGAFSYHVEFEGEVEDRENFGEEDIAPFVVKSVEYAGLGSGASDADVPLE
jgi:hypothetical protein